MSGASRETVSRIFTELAKERIISFTKAEILIHKDLIDGDYAD